MNVVITTKKLQSLNPELGHISRQPPWHSQLQVFSGTQLPCMFSVTCSQLWVIAVVPTPNSVSGAMLAVQLTCQASPLWSVSFPHQHCWSVWILWGHRLVCEDSGSPYSTWAYSQASLIYAIFPPKVRGKEVTLCVYKWFFLNFSI